jgi:hypothetical protein
MLLNHEMDLPEELAKDPAHESYFSVAQSLAGEGKLVEASGVIIRALDVNPALDRGRLLLSRLFFEIGAPRFAAREVQELMVRNPSLKSLVRLREALEPGVAVAPAAQPKKFAETRFAASELEALEAAKEK